MVQVHRFSRRSLGPQRLSDARGLTLVEVMCATFVLLFAIASSIVAMQSGFRSIDTARGITLASQILQSEIENIRLLAWDDVKELDDAEIEYTDGAEQENAERLHLTVERTVTDFGDPSDEIKEVTLTATWRGIDGRSHTRSTSTRYCRNGLNDFLATDPAR